MPDSCFCGMRADVAHFPARDVPDGASNFRHRLHWLGPGRQAARLRAKAVAGLVCPIAKSLARPHPLVPWQWLFQVIRCRSDAGRLPLGSPACLGRLAARLPIRRSARCLVAALALLESVLQAPSWPARSPGPDDRARVESAPWHFGTSPIPVCLPAPARRPQRSDSGLSGSVVQCRGAHARLEYGCRPVAPFLVCSIQSVRFVVMAPGLTVAKYHPPSFVLI